MGGIKKNIIKDRKCIVCLKNIPQKTNGNLISIKQYLKSKFCSKKCKGKFDSKHFKGSNNPNWKGGVSTINEKIRGSKEYRLWRQSVFERDNYTCIWCYKRGGELNADHIKPFALFPELRFAIDNGRTLCVPCHKTTETYKCKNIKQKYGRN